MTVRKIKGEWYVDTYVRRPGKSPQRLRKRAPVQTKRDAEAYERQLLLDAHGLSERPARTFEDFVVTDLAAYVKAHNRKSESESKSSILRLHLLPVFGHRLLSEIGTKDAELYAAEKARARAPGKKGLSPKSINNHLTVLRKTLALAVEYGDLEKVPHLKWRTVPEQKFRFLSFAEADRLIASADAGLWRAMITVALRTGMRRGELFALRWGDVDFERGRITIARAIVRESEGPTKNGKSRTVPLTDDAIAALRSVRGTVDLVFHEAGQPLRRSNAKHPLWRACRKAKVEPLAWHALRHTFASHLAMRGVPMRAIMELLGHSSMTMTLRYAHLSPDSLVDAIAALQGPQLGTSLKTKDGKESNVATLRRVCVGFDSRRLHRVSSTITLG